MLSLYVTPRSQSVTQTLSTVSKPKTSPNHLSKALPVKYIDHHTFTRFAKRAPNFQKQMFGRVLASTPATALTHSRVKGSAGQLTNSGYLPASHSSLRPRMDMSLSEEGAPRLTFNLELMMNVECVLEEISILFGVQDLQNLFNKCTKWWDATVKLFHPDLEWLYRTPEERSEQDRGSKLSLLTIALTQYLSHIYSQKKQSFASTSPEKKAEIKQIQAALHAVHQSFLITLFHLYEKISSSRMNNKEYIEGLHNILNIKLVRSQGKSLRGLQIIHHEGILSILRKIFSSNPRIKFYRVSSMSLSILSKIDYRTFREIICQELFLQVKCCVEDPMQGCGSADTRSTETLLPKIQKAKKEKLYTLVLDLDETLVHSIIDDKDQTQIFVRPGAKEFIKEMSKYYELVIFTAGTKEYAEWALTFIDPEKVIQYCLSREHTIQKGPICIKDISKIGRNLRRVIIIDNVVENFELQPNNGIFIKSWTEDPKDDSLSRLTPLLKQIVDNKVKDVRVALRNYRDSQMRTLIHSKQERMKPRNNFL